MISDKRATASAAVYAAGHFLVDFSCALMMLRTLPEPVLFLVYNFCAFAMQMPIGLLADILGQNRPFALTGIGLVLFAALPLPVPVRVISMGLGNACYHVGGGREALLQDDRMTGLGIFVSPGAVGIYLGTVLAQNEAVHIFVFAALMVIAAAAMLLCPGGITRKELTAPRPMPALLMMTVVIVRSMIGLSMESPWKLGIYVTAGALAAAAGKAAGGFLGDKLGSRNAGVLSLILAAVLFLMPDMGIAGVFGVLLFNMTMPITLRRACDAVPGMEGFGFGLLTFGLFLGYVPSAFGVTFAPWIGSVLSLVCAALLLLDKGDAA